MSAYLSWGIINHSMATLHAEGKHSAETITQALLGTPVRVLQRRKDWRLIQLPEGYQGWVSGSVVELDDNQFRTYTATPKIVVTSHYAQTYYLPEHDSYPCSDVVSGNILRLVDTLDTYYHIAYPDGRTAYLQKSDGQLFYCWLDSREISGEAIVRTAKTLMGIPYVWGGTSAKGLDCSGFVKLVYFLHGIILLRDASQQVHTGQLIDENGDFSLAMPGDLVFFGEKIDGDSPREKVVHVGIALGNQQFIHASDNVHVSSFNPEDSCFDAFNTNRYLRTKRIIGHVESKGIQPIKGSWYGSF